MKGRGAAYLLPILFVVFTAEPLFAARTELISRGVDGSVGDGRSADPSISRDARYVVYESTARNLVEDKTTGNRDIFLFDRITGTTERISKPATDEGNSSSFDAEISADGSVVVFTSQASNLVEGDTEGHRDIFAYDRETDELTRVSVDSDGVAADGDSANADVSGNGRYVVFQSAGTNLVGDDTNNQVDIFRHDRLTGETVRVSLDFLDGEVLDWDSEEPVISDDGRYVAFQTRAALIPCDENNSMDVYLRDMIENLTVLGSTTFYGCVPNSSSFHPSMSADGRFIGFSSHATNLVLEDDTNGQQDVFIRDRELMTTERISVGGSVVEGDERSVGYGGNISADGQYVTFSSPATTFDQDSNGGYDVFARDRAGSATSRESVGTYWEEGSGDATANVAVISASGKYIVFDSSSSGLVPGDTNNDWDIFIRDYLWDGPLITEISPKSGDFNGGTLLTITGSNFDAGAAVTIDGTPALNVTVNSAGTVITCITPPHEVGTVELQVTNTDGTTWIYPINRGVFHGYIYRPLSLPFLPLLMF